MTLSNQITIPTMAAKHLLEVGARGGCGHSRRSLACLVILSRSVGVRSDPMLPSLHRGSRSHVPRLSESVCCGQAERRVSAGVTCKRPHVQKFMVCESRERGGVASYSRTKTLQSQLLVHALCLALLIDGCRLEFEDLAEDLKLSQAEIRALVRELVRGSLKRRGVVLVLFKRRIGSGVARFKGSSRVLNSEFRVSSSLFNNRASPH